VADLPADGSLKALEWVGDYNDDARSFSMSDAELADRVSVLRATPVSPRGSSPTNPGRLAPTSTPSTGSARTSSTPSTPPPRRSSSWTGTPGARRSTRSPAGRARPTTSPSTPTPAGRESRASSTGRQVIARLDSSGIADYWGVIQAFEDGGRNITMESDTASGVRTLADDGRDRRPVASAGGPRR
jgi:hypothetical protein